jgi:hypothetical protein
LAIRGEAGGEVAAEDAIDGAIDGGEEKRPLVADHGSAPGRVDVGQVKEFVGAEGEDYADNHADEDGEDTARDAA